MKFILFTILIPLLCCTACREISQEHSFINHAEALIETEPDSAYILLNRIAIPEQLNDKLFVRWCMLSGQLADALHKDMPHISFLIRAHDWLKQNGTLCERAQIGLYLGRSYVEDKKYEEAIVVYKEALEIAISNKNYNLTGFICSYMADLYSFKDMPCLSRQKYSEGAQYFLKAQNKRSYALALRDISYTYCLQDSFNLALDCLKQAESIIQLWNDSIAYSSITNALGNVYEMMDSLDNAEKYLLKSLDFDNNDIAPSYLALSRMYIDNGDLDKGKYYLSKSEGNPQNAYISAGTIYQYYMIEKEMDNPYKALSYLESYNHISDSISKLQNEARIDEIEKKYDHIKLLSENDKLRISQLYSFILLIIAVATSLLMAFLYQLKSKRDNKIMYEQLKDLDSKEKKLLQFVVDLDSKEKELQQLNLLLAKNEQFIDVEKTLDDKVLIYQRQKKEICEMRNEIITLKHKMLFSTSIVKKIISLSQIIVPGATKSPLTNKDWRLLMNKVDEIYFLFSEKLLKQSFKEDSVEMHYCYLTLLQLDKAQESVILNINPESVSKLRFRVRKKLNIVGDETSIYEYLTCV